MNKSPRIIFFGTPDFAVTSLIKLLDAGYPVVAVVTAPDKPAGRGLKERLSPVKMAAMAHEIPVLQPPKMNDPDFINHLKSLNPDLQIVIAFRMMPKSVWELPRMGTFNLHASLLPQYRGAAPIHWAVINGEKETGVTTFFINETIDTGGILLREKVPIGDRETTGELHDRLMKIGANLVTRTVEGLFSGEIQSISQDSLYSSTNGLKTAPKIFKEDCRIQWKQPTDQVCNFIRGLSPHPGAFTEVKMTDGTVQTLKIFHALPNIITHTLTPGIFVTDRKTFLKVSTIDGFIMINEVQLAGRKTMNTVDFLRGFGKIFPETCGI
ncbi:MAG: methionyl-tRNA formyltransferase [Bacteroidales bacterium]|nr:methionyl-tRNA formyltransferase [Bacteroidales bacterium]